MTESSRITDAAERLRAAVRANPAPRAWVGLDGFVDEIVRAVDKRHSADRFEPMATIGQYAARIAAAAGKSTNIELVTERIKLGGNGPLMGEAMGRLGARLDYVGSVGLPEMEPVFAPLAAYGTVRPIARPGITLAAEFDDGKIMMGRMEGLREVTFENLERHLGGIEALAMSLRSADVLALVNWTMLPHMTDILARMRPLVAGLGAEAPRVAFFDLCDPAKRPVEDLRAAIHVMADFSSAHTTAILGLNEAESEQVAAALGVPAGSGDGPGLVARARAIAKAVGISEVVIHPQRRASAWGGASGEGTIEGPYCMAPRLTTGAGDHFNGGYVFARTIGLSPADALVAGKGVSGFYVRNGRGPSPEELIGFCGRWAAGAADS